MADSRLNFRDDSLYERAVYLKKNAKRPGQAPGFHRNPETTVAFDFPFGD